MGDERGDDGAGGRLSQEDVALLTEQIAGLSAAGLPLASGLRALAEEQPSRRLRGVLGRLSRALEAGEPLELALGAPSAGVPGHLRGLVAAGARTGRLGHVLARFAGYASFGADLRRRLWLSLMYPLVAWILATGLLGFFVVSLAGTFGTIFQDFGVPVPLLTRILLGLSRFLVAFWEGIPWAVGAALAIGILLALFSTGPRRRSFIAHLPLIGWVWRLTSLAELCHLLALLLESEVPLGEALTLAGEGVGDADVGKACRGMAAEVDAGSSLATAVGVRRLFPAGVARMLAWAEAHRGLPEALHMAGELFEARARARAQVTAVVCKVLTFTLIVTGIVLVIGAVIVPLFALFRRML